MGVDWQCQQFEKAEYCLFEQRELTGNGNYSVAIAQGGVITRAFYMMDSNGLGNPSEESLANGHTTREVGFGFDQITWYQEQIGELKKVAPEVKISLASARDQLHEALDVQSARLTVVQTVRGERPAYEFLCAYDGQQYLIYTDAISGAEIAIINVKNAG